MDLLEAERKRDELMSSPEYYGHWKSPAVTAEVERLSKLIADEKQYRRDKIDAAIREFNTGS